MSKMIEVFLGEDGQASRSEVVLIANNAGGRLTYEEESGAGEVQKGICLTFEFETVEKAEQVIKLVTERGFHVEGPSEY